jgi:hypothetical protein
MTGAIAIMMSFGFFMALSYGSPRRPMLRAPLPPVLHLVPPSPMRRNTVPLVSLVRSGAAIFFARSQGALMCHTSMVRRTLVVSQEWQVRP